MKKLLFCTIALFNLLAASAQLMVSTYAGDGYAKLKNGQRDTCSFNGPWGMCVDKNNNLYVADAGNNCIRKINIATGAVSTVAGGAAGYRDSTALYALFHTPVDICVDDTGSLYVSDFDNQCVRKISIDNTVTTIAGSRIQKPGYRDDISDSALFQYPRGICINKAGDIFVGDSWNHRIRKIDNKTWDVTTYAGGGITGVGSAGALVDTKDTAARFNVPCGLFMDNVGAIYVADAYNHRIRKVDTDRNVTTIAGSGPTGKFSGGFADGDTTTTLFNTPTEVYVNGKQIYVGDLVNNRVRLINLLTDSVFTLAGIGTAGYTDEVDSLAEFNNPRGMAVDTSGKILYLADWTNNVIRAIELSTGETVNVISLNAEAGINVFPNPFTAQVTVSGLIAGEKTLKLFDVNGKQLNSWQVAATHTTLDLHLLPVGTYLLQYTNTNGQTVTGKIVKINN